MIFYRTDVRSKAEMSQEGGKGGEAFPSSYVLADQLDQLTVFKPVGAAYVHHITIGPHRFLEGAASLYSRYLLCPFYCIHISFLKKRCPNYINGTDANY